MFHQVHASQWWVRDLCQFICRCRVSPFPNILPPRFPLYSLVPMRKKGLFLHPLARNSQDSFQNCTPCVTKKFHRDVPTLVTEYFQKRRGDRNFTVFLSQRDAFPSFFDQKRKAFFSKPRFPHHDHYCFPNGAGLREEAREKKETGQTKKYPRSLPPATVSSWRPPIPSLLVKWEHFFPEFYAPAFILQQIFILYFHLI